MKLIVTKGELSRRSTSRRTVVQLQDSHKVLSRAFFVSAPVELHIMRGIKVSAKVLAFQMQNFRRLCTCRMKFSRLPVLPRPLETFHSADEKRPRITFTKYTRGSPPRSRSLLDPFPPRSPETWNTILWYGSLFLKKDARSSSLANLVERGRETNANEREGMRREGRKEREKNNIRQREKGVRDVEA